MAESKAELTDRWRREGREEEVARFRLQVRNECRARRLSRKESNEHAWSEATRNFPPLPSPKQSEPPREDAAVPAVASPEAADSGRVQGLTNLPADWPELPGNASLAAEIGWVQANRLYVVEERPSGRTVVRLEKARSPAPSWSALSWLETSIRCYAKFIEVAAKTASTGQDEQEFIRKERMQIAEIDALLAEMMPRS